MTERDDLVEAGRVEAAIRVEDMDWRDIFAIQRDYLRLLVTEHADELKLSTVTPAQVREYLSLADRFFAGQGVTSSDLVEARVEAITLAEHRLDRESNDAKIFDIVWRQLFDDLDLETRQDPVYFLLLNLLAKLSPSFAHDYASYLLRRVETDYPEFVITVDDTVDLA